jgi:hypothetical protein
MFPLLLYLATASQSIQSLTTSWVDLPGRMSAHGAPKQRHGAPKGADPRRRHLSALFGARPRRQVAWRKWCQMKGLEEMDRSCPFSVP